MNSYARFGINATVPDLRLQGKWTKSARTVILMQIKEYILKESMKTSDFQSSACGLFLWDLNEVGCAV